MAFQPATAATSSFTFYDIEELSNVFSLVAYTPRPAGIADTLEIFHLVDDDALDAAIVDADLVRAVKEQNPGLPEVNVVRRDLRTEMANLRLAQLFGVSDAEQVCDPLSPSSFPAGMRPVCDTDEDYDPALHPFLGGYNSMNYDTVMLAQYLSEVFGGFPVAQKELEEAEARLEEMESRRRALQLVGVARASAQRPVRGRPADRYRDGRGPHSRPRPRGDDRPGGRSPQTGPSAARPHWSRRSPRRSATAAMLRARRQPAGCWSTPRTSRSGSTSARCSTDSPKPQIAAPADQSAIASRRRQVAHSAHFPSPEPP